MSHVLEHMPDPRYFLKLVHEKLKTGGKLFIDVPCKDYLYKDIDEPHVLFFNIQSLSFLLMNIGFTINWLDYFGPNIPIKLIGRLPYFLHLYIRKIIAKLYSLYPRLQRLILLIMKLPSNSTSFTILTKPTTLSNKPSWWIRCICSKVNLNQS